MIKVTGREKRVSKQQYFRLIMVYNETSQTATLVRGTLLEICRSSKTLLNHQQKAII